MEVKVAEQAEGGALSPSLWLGGANRRREREGGGGDLRGREKWAGYACMEHAKFKPPPLLCAIFGGSSTMPSLSNSAAAPAYYWTLWLLVLDDRW
jgi:hypothetical protein